MEEEARKAAIVAAERQRMLLGAAHLREHLPKGLVQSMQELSLIESAGRQVAGPPPLPESACQQGGGAQYVAGGWGDAGEQQQHDYQGLPTVHTSSMFVPAAGQAERWQQGAGAPAADRSPCTRRAPW